MRPFALPASLSLLHAGRSLRFRTLSCSLVCLIPASLVAQQTVLGKILEDPARIADIKRDQPSWTSPLVTANPSLSQLLRTTVMRQRMPAGNSQWNIDNGKGLNLILTRHLETDISLPNYIFHNVANQIDGFGDEGITVKYRIASGGQTRGNYIFTALFGNTWSSGSAKNGSVASTQSYTLAGGKGIGHFNVQSAAGVTLPDSNLTSLGRPVAWNTAFQYHVTKRFWAELEDNVTFYKGGSKDGYKQNYLTPVAVLTRVKRASWENTPRSFTFSAGMQIATTHYHSSDHNLYLDAKAYF
jgi:hypothetical protein